MDRTGLTTMRQAVAWRFEVDPYSSPGLVLGDCRAHEGRATLVMVMVMVVAVVSGSMAGEQGSLFGTPGWCLEARRGVVERVVAQHGTA